MYSVTGNALLEPNDSCQEPKGIDVVSRMVPLLEGSRKGYSNDIPHSFAEELLVKKFRVTSVQSVPLRAEV